MEHHEKLRLPFSPKYFLHAITSGTKYGSAIMWSILAGIFNTDPIVVKLFPTDLGDKVDILIFGSMIGINVTRYFDSSLFYENVHPKFIRI